MQSGAQNPSKIQNNRLNSHQNYSLKITHITLHKHSLIHDVSITRLKLKLLYREKYEQNTRQWERWIFGKNVVLSAFEGICTHTKTAKYLKYIILNECDIPSISDINTFNCLQFEVSNSVFLLFAKWIKKKSFSILKFSFYSTYGVEIKKRVYIIIYGNCCYWIIINNFIMLN